MIYHQQIICKQIYYLEMVYHKYYNDQWMVFITSITSIMEIIPIKSIKSIQSIQPIKIISIDSLRALKCVTYNFNLFFFLTFYILKSCCFSYIYFFFLWHLQLFRLFVFVFVCLSCNYFFVLFVYHQSIICIRQHLYLLQLFVIFMTTLHFEFICIFARDFYFKLLH